MSDVRLQWEKALQPKDIVVPTDFSDEASAALQTATWLMPGKVRIHLVHVLPPMPDDPDWTDEHEEQRRFSVERLLETEAEAADGNVVTRLILGSGGNPASEIVQYAEDIDAQLVVMSGLGQSALEALLMGSVTDSVLRRSPCPVLVLRGGDADGRDWGRILVPYDFSEHARKGLEVGSALAGERGSLYVVHIASFLPPTTPDFAIELFDGNDRIDKAYDALDLAVEAAGVGDATTRVEVGMRANAGGQIVEVADEMRIGLIVLTSRGRGPLQNILLGSTAVRVARLAKCPVLMLPVR